MAARYGKASIGVTESARRDPDVRIHLDTDLGSNPDDACALAMLLGSPDVELVGITTTTDPGGRRAGCVSRLLDLAERNDIPVAAGAEVSLSPRYRPRPIPNDDPYWPSPVAARPSPVSTALHLLEASINDGAIIVAIGPYTNLALLERSRPGTLDRATIVVMGGWIRSPADGLPNWGPKRDWNVQCDTRAAQILISSARPTLVTFPVTLKAHLRAEHLPRLRSSGPLGELLARQVSAHAEALGMRELVARHSGLPKDLLNFQHDAVACAVAAGWPAVTVEEMSIIPIVRQELLAFEEDKRGQAVPVTVDLEASYFQEAWLSAAVRAGSTS